MSIPIINSEQLRLGQWTDTAHHALGFIWEVPASASGRGVKRYMYVQFNDGGGGVAAGHGTPVGIRVAEMETGSTNDYEVTSDESETNGLLGFIVSCDADGDVDLTTDITDDYYGFIQLHEPGAVVESAVCVSDAVGNSLVCWAADYILGTTTWASIGPKYASKACIIMTSVTYTTGPASTTRTIADVLCV